LTVGMKTGRSLELDNVFMTQSALNDLYYKLKNLTYYPYNLNYQGHLLLEVGQWVTIQTNKKETFKVPVLSQSFTFKGGLRGRISADSKAGNDTQYSYEGTITKQIKQQDGIEAKIQAQIEAADKDFDQKVDKIKKDFNDQVELAKARAEEVKRELSDTINQRFNSFDNGPLKETKRTAEEALRNAGASTLLAQEAKRIELDSVARLEAFKSQTTSAQTALSGDLDVLKQTIVNDIRPKQAQAEAEIAKQVEALSRTKNELAGVKSAQATYEETTTRRLSELTNLAKDKASKSELTQTAEELASRIASVHLGRRNLLKGTKELARYKPVSEYNGFKVIRTVAGATRYQDSYVERTVIPTAGTEYIAIFYARASENDYPVRCHFYNPNTVVSSENSSGYKSRSSDGLSIIRLSTDWQLCWVKWTQTATDQAKTVIIGRHGPQVGGKEGVWVEICAPAIFEGNLAGDWSPAYEDQDERVSAVESNFKQRADSLEAGVNRLTEGLRTKADISSLNVTAENIRQSVKSLETDTQNKLNQKLSQAEFEV
ncbi:peptidase S74, partial [Streptococcus pneumoniae]|nr:peptidase S74 [Streptococcus pneumoniae]